MIKLTKKQKEIVETALQLEKENNCTIYFKYDNFSKKIHPIKINEIEETQINYERFPQICSHTVATTMESKGILVPESITSNLTLCKLNPGVLL